MRPSDGYTGSHGQCFPERGSLERARSGPFALKKTGVAAAHGQENTDRGYRYKFRVPGEDDVPAAPSAPSGPWAARGDGKLQIPGRAGHGRALRNRLVADRPARPGPSARSQEVPPRWAILPLWEQPFRPSPLCRPSTRRAPVEDR
jgi:hypothetical protein